MISMYIHLKNKMLKKLIGDLISYFVLFFIITLSLFSNCSFAQEKNTQIMGAMGIQFSFSEQKLKELGFVPANISERKDVGLWIEGNNSIPDDFFESRSVYITPVSKKIFSIKGMRLYSSSKSQNHFSTCSSDLQEIRNVLSRKYSGLTFVPSYSTKYEDEKKQGVILRYYYEFPPVATKQSDQISNYGSGKLILLACGTQNSGIGTILTVQYYLEYGVRKNFDKELDLWFRENILNKKGLKDDKF